MKARSVIIGVIILIIGFVLGMLTSAQIRYHRLKPVRIYFSEERFREGFYNVIQPDKEQKEKIDNVLSKYAGVNSEIQNDFRKKLDAMMKDFWNEMEPNINKDQFERLKQMDERRMEMIRQNRRNPHRDSLDLRDNHRREPRNRRGPDYIDSPMPPFDKKVQKSVDDSLRRRLRDKK
jgi:hypothetical protein